MSTWLANRCIGTGPEGYGALLAEVCFTISRVGESTVSFSSEAVRLTLW